MADLPTQAQTQAAMWARLQAEASSFAPLASPTGYEAPWSPMSRSPLGQAGIPGMLLSAGLESLAGPYARAHGYANFGLAPRNSLDAGRQALRREQMRSMYETSLPEDSRRFMEAMQGAHRLAGKELTAEGEAGLAKAFRSVAGFMPDLALSSPGALRAFDIATGGRSKAVLGQMVLQASPRVYDPVSGASSMSTASAMQLRDQLHANLVESKDWNLTSLQTGELLGEMARRDQLPNMPLSGLRAAAASTVSRALSDGKVDATLKARTGSSARELLAQAGVKAPEPGQELTEREIAGIDRTDAGRKLLRGLQADKIEEEARKGGKAIDAMRDIFAEFGQEGSVGEMMDQLEALTMASGVVDPEKLGMSARRLNEVARQTGGDLAGLRNRISTAAAYGAQYGVARELAPEAASAGALASRSLSGARSGFGGRTAEQSSQSTANRIMRFAASEDGQAMGALQRLADSAEGGLEKGSEAAVATEAMARGETSYSWQGRTTNLTKDNLARVYNEARDSKGRRVGSDFDKALQDGVANQEALGKNGMLNNLALGTQNREVAQRRVEVLQQSLRSDLLAAGAAPEEAERMAAAAASRVDQDTQRAVDKDRTALEGPAKMQAVFGVGLANTEAAKFLESRGQAPQGAAMNAASALQAYTRREHGMTGSSSYLETSEFVRKDVQAGQVEADANAMMRAALKDQRQRGLWEKVVDSLVNVDPNDPEALRKAAAEGLGYENLAEVEAKLRPQLDQIVKARNQFLEEAKKAAAEPDPRRRKEMQENAAGKLRGLDSALSTVQETLDTVGEKKAKEARSQAEAKAKEAKEEGRAPGAQAAVPGAGTGTGAAGAVVAKLDGPVRMQGTLRLENGQAVIEGMMSSAHT